MPQSVAPGLETNIAVLLVLYRCALSNVDTRTTPSMLWSRYNTLARTLKRPQSYYEDKKLKRVHFSLHSVYTYCISPDFKSRDQRNSLRCSTTASTTLRRPCIRSLIGNYPVLIDQQVRSIEAGARRGWARFLDLRGVI